MTRFIYRDHLPANSRIIVDYTKKQKVKFSYPLIWTYKKAVWKRGFLTVLSFWVALHSLIILYLMIYISPFYLLYLFLFPFKTVGTSYYDFYHLGLPILIVTFYFIGIPFLFTLIASRNKEFFSNIIPKLGYWKAKIGGNVCIKLFKPKDIYKNKAIIPLFSNTFLDYKCTGDFNKYLKKIEIMEIPFEYKKRRLFIPFKVYKEKNDFVFRAVFYFIKKPLNGEMYVEFD